MNNNSVTRPLFTIAIPTYNRECSLKDIVTCYLDQEFQNFEIIIANDYIDKKLSMKSLGMELDSRVTIINNEKNLGELENMNFLLDQAKGYYFTWQFDDDPCSDIFLSTMATAVSSFRYPDSIFSSFETIYGDNKKRLKCDSRQKAVCYSGPMFVEKYLNKELRALGCCGFYKLEFLRQLGGVVRLSSGPMALFSEFLLLVKQMTAKKVVYLNTPLVSTRHHHGSWTYNNNDVILFQEAGINYINESYRVLDNFNGTLKHTLFLRVVNFVLATISVKLWQCTKTVSSNEIREYINVLKLECSTKMDTDTRERFENELNIVVKRSWGYFIKAMLKRYMPFTVFNIFENFRK
jgi:glycosyltransferase involved in cell wall biosynthesis